MGDYKNTPSPPLSALPDRRMAMAATGGTPHVPEYHAQFETKFNGRTNMTYYRYVILSDLDTQLFDGYAGDMKEARDAVKAHLRLLRAQSGLYAQEQDRGAPWTQLDTTGEVN
jgi:hypothetical protein